ncbi:maltose alpha-D-glucosyltransferase [Jiella sp. MQZ9-1]|uniref:maltose alpha-D-glucosyltransferase n=1 Tax=Jiella flava TaxID=2816857 RepID=A0A939JUD5_9HYPH|nr:maltose alpha-D-glucosyltransferase [Jiella flava]MBO0661309.1 maltose alpha-D-glucosyltransferase [Jiella flava]MCD2469953.1 maltose alpha-D-glucosyltransferase [Jiella flava]
MNEIAAIVTPDTSSGPDLNAPDWYKDAIIYQLHVKTFVDSNGDGIGDFPGLLSRLDYIQELGVTAIWLLPFYPSPLRDDGYDISDYRSVNPSYGTIEDVERLIDEAHKRGMRVITELVINHTSDQHPWFQAARKAPKGSPERDFYVWADDDKGYDLTRIIFLDTETSNWTWDPVAQQYFWHRFYSHQPDLNFDNPKVMEEVLSTMHFWLDKGVDGLRLDAIPYLVEREGTNNENLPETHDVLKRIRADLDKHYPDKMLLAEANQWPEDTRPYFGEGDECHMAFHFPLMPRMYMALAQEDRHPITDIMRQTPDIPDNCQWAIFLRNHDELTLEMVTEEERDYLWSTYAADTRARINLGIRRRLAPLMGNDRRKVELLNALLMSMPGTPVVYYGDEIGMGDNYYLGDRDGVRTPMQWSADRNGGFSRADPQRLYLPVIQDAVFGYQALNVEAQSNNPASQLNWTRRLIQVRRTKEAFGRGEITFLLPSNRKILVYLRKFADERVLCVANLSGSAQAVELDLADYAGCVPIEMLGLSAFPAIGTGPYVLTLPAYGFFWFDLADGGAAQQRYPSTPLPLPAFSTLVAPGDLKATIGGRNLTELKADLPSYVAGQRWFAGKSAGKSRLDVTVLGPPAPDSRRHLLTELKFETEEDDQHYLLPLSVRWGEQHLNAQDPDLPYTIAKVRQGPRIGALIDGTRSADFAKVMIALIAAGINVELDDGELVVEASTVEREGLARTLLVDTDAIRVLSGEQSNTSLLIGSDGILKYYRRLRDGIQPELEVTRFLTEKTDFEAAPALYGSIELQRPDGSRTAIAALFEQVQNQGDAWTVIVEALARYLRDHAYSQPSVDETLEAGSPSEPKLQIQIDPAEVLGRRTGEMHAALATTTGDAAFDPELLDDESYMAIVNEAKKDAADALGVLAKARPNLPADEIENVDRLLGAEKDILTWFDRFGGLKVDAQRTRIHGDYHLGQILVAKNDVVILDFEGEPGRTLEERRAKTSPLRDVAGLVRSFDYAAFAARDRAGPVDEATAERLREMAVGWRDEVTDAFLTHWSAAAGLPLNEPTRQLLDLFVLQKAFYELRYEAAMRPAWLSIPLRGIVALLEKRQVLK